MKMKKLINFKKKVHDTGKKLKKNWTNYFAKFGKPESLTSLKSLTSSEELRIKVCETFGEKLQKIEKIPTEFSVGERCTALCYEDSTWYNAKVEAIDEDGKWYMVIFTNYNYKSKVDYRDMIKEGKNISPLPWEYVDRHVNKTNSEEEYEHGSVYTDNDIVSARRYGGFLVQKLHFLGITHSRKGYFWPENCYFWKFVLIPEKVIMPK